MFVKTTRQLAQVDVVFGRGAATDDEAAVGYTYRQLGSRSKNERHPCVQLFDGTSEERVLPGIEGALVDGYCQLHDEVEEVGRH